MEKQYLSHTSATNSLLGDLRPLAHRADTTIGLGYSSPATLETHAQEPGLLCRQMVVTGREEGSTWPPRSLPPWHCTGQELLGWAFSPGKHQATNSTLGWGGEVGGDK